MIVLNLVNHIDPNIGHVHILNISYKQSQWRVLYNFILLIVTGPAALLVKVVISKTRGYWNNVIQIQLNHEMLFNVLLVLFFIRKWFGFAEAAVFPMQVMLSEDGPCFSD